MQALKRRYSRLKKEEAILPDLLIIDGPPGSLCPLSRAPAFDFFRDRLSKQCVILLDDGHRDDERAAINIAQEELSDFSFSLHDSISGMWVISHNMNHNTERDSTAACYRP